MIKKIVSLLGGLLFVFFSLYGQNPAFSIDYCKGLAVWFDSPTTSSLPPAWTINNGDVGTNPDQEWEQKSLPIGNGNFGANILGAVKSERITLNEKTLWMGGPGANSSAYWDMNREAAKYLPEIRKMLDEGNLAETEELVKREFQGKIDYNSSLFGTFTTMGEISIETNLNEDIISDYKRILNLDSSLAIVQFKDKNLRYQRSYFASHADNIMVIRFLSENVKQNLTFSLQSPQILSASVQNDEMVYSGMLKNNGEKFVLRVYVRSLDGKIYFDDGKIQVDSATDVEFILAAATSYSLNFNPDFADSQTYFSANPNLKTAQWIENAKNKSYRQLLNNHIADYISLFNRVQLSLTTTTEKSNLIPTNRRLENLLHGSQDFYLEELYFQFGRYLLISSSRVGEMPANLQGLWHNNVEGPWRVDYHNNINLQMNYWLATTTNLLECYEPLINYIRSLVIPGRKTASSYFGARGWTTSISGNIYGFTAPLKSGDMTWNYNPVAGPWLATHLWSYYLYSQDVNWLKEIGYPIIRESADFAEDLLHKNKEGMYSVSPSWSPEHGSIDVGATYCNAVLKEILKDATLAAKLVNDSTHVDTWQSLYDSILPYKIGRMGQLQEWSQDVDDSADYHRHTNHLFGLHPGSTITALGTPELADACRVTLNQRGDLSTGWSMGWKINHWARLHDGNRAYRLLQMMLQNSTADNLFDLHPPFQIDGNFGATAGIAEMLLQSSPETIILLPALPDAWKEGSISGLLAQGGIEVDIVWKNNRLSYANLTAKQDTEITLIYGNEARKISLKRNIRYQFNVH